MKQINNKALMQIGYLRFYFDESNLVKLAPAIAVLEQDNFVLERHYYDSRSIIGYELKYRYDGSVKRALSLHFGCKYNIKQIPKETRRFLHRIYELWFNELRRQT